MENRWEMNNNQRIVSLYEILCSYAPDDKARKLCDNFLNKTETTDKEVIIELTKAIADGLFYGNWPWVRMELRLLTK